MTLNLKLSAGLNTTVSDWWREATRNKPLTGDWTAGLPAAFTTQPGDKK